MPTIDIDDLLLFGSLALAALGSAMTVAATTANGWLAAGIGLIVFGAPSTVIAFLAAGDNS